MNKSLISVIKPINEDDLSTWRKYMTKDEKINEYRIFLEELKSCCVSELSLIGGGESMIKKIEKFLNDNK